MDARERFVRWFEASGKSKVEVAEALGCSDAYVGYLISGKRERVGLDLAFKIEELTADWDEGPILAREWRSEHTMGEADAPAESAKTGTEG